ncbi:Hsp20/alpha crystallin family protein [Peribacillus muralis]|uniref:Hsp20/alpha crystallin family protein n=1 Tax=Peribacillus muralis TaxID=264697 RepID=UPI001F4E676F|nr:Hsp20/alpha crystallin family protein [Peribacillus muralis]MCK1991103.1 Hsp20/alpha crystallin family protein [Peribacillus muralis]MCK2011657.1 Hsp20/alpha crystallin family protein [Peribacillus muralis]
MFPWNSLFSFKNNPNQKDFMKNMQQSDVQSFMEKMFYQVIPDNMQGMMNNNDFGSKKEAARTEHPMHADVFETHLYVFVRIPIVDESWLKKMKLYHTSNQSIIEGIPEASDRHVITLPALVKKKGASAQFKESTLEIRLQKSFNTQYSEIDVSDI